MFLKISQLKASLQKKTHQNIYPQLIHMILQEGLVIKDIYLYNIPGWSSFKGRSAVTTLGDKTNFGSPFVFCVLELSRKSPCL